MVSALNPRCFFVCSGNNPNIVESFAIVIQKDHPAVLALEEKIFEMAKSRGKFTSVNLDPTAANFADIIASWKSKAQVITLGHDIPFIQKMFSDVVKTARKS